MNEPLTIEVDACANPHSHLREGDVVGPLIEQAIKGGVDLIGPMPNTKDGLTKASHVATYIEQARRLVPKGEALNFIPIVMLNEQTTEENIVRCVGAGIVDGKIYPYMRTTKSHNGVQYFGKMVPIVKWCGRYRMKVHLHPEHPSPQFHNRDAEFAFLAITRMLLEESEAKIISEHGTDARCIPHWKDMAASGRFFVTITAHHLATNEDITFGDVRAVCKPPIKTEDDRLGLVTLVEKNYPWVMAGADDAPHDWTAKHIEAFQCACGAYTAPFLLPLYAHALDNLLQEPNGVETFVNFTSRNARKLHDFPNASRKIKLARHPAQIPLYYEIGSWKVGSFWAGEMLKWSFA